MAKYFQVTRPEGLSAVKLDSQGRAAVQFIAKNVSASAIDGRAVLVSLPSATPPSGPVEKGWVKIDGESQRHFDKDREEAFVVKVAVPPKSPSGTYTFRLDVVSVARPDEGDQGPSVAFNVAAGPTPNGGGGLKWLLIALVIVLVLAIGGIATWLILRKPEKTTTQTPQPPAQPTPQPQPPRPTPLPYGPDTCKQGFVWREAVPNDHVCVTPDVRTQAAEDNLQAARRRNPGGGPYGPDTCLQGYVWREAVPNDHVCVTVQTRAQAAADNAQAASRKAQP